MTTPEPTNVPVKIRTVVTERAPSDISGLENETIDAALPGRTGSRVEIRDLSAFYGSHLAVTGVNLIVEPTEVTALIGPSGCGKSTVLRCVNGMHLNTPTGRVQGQVLIDDINILGKGVDPVLVRRNVGMVFQRPNPFPTMSIYDNVVAGLRLGRRGRRTSEYDDIVEVSLTRAGLWPEVKDRLKAAGSSLSGGQQQRLCIARALAVEPRVLLMDEPCSALDPISTLVIEDLIAELKASYTIIIVTHNMQQAARVSDTTAFLTVPGLGQAGALVEIGPTSRIFSNPNEKATEDYITGKVG
ncbi:phosphate ABC transporter ATP-binding protein [Fodinicola feengrottensis]|uniref:Phosphate ABC transporter ATP-binding protein PstB n=1 Tax=Fodinicola feengrottensis TaxID=435914 RepID=A0ABP4VCI2_9ACTN|nr:phosphate ABC transporter ATP-binding protein [Fodinicola feengrottensis]